VKTKIYQISLNKTNSVAIGKPEQQVPEA